MKKILTFLLLLLYTSMCICQDNNYEEKKKFGYSPSLEKLISIVDLRNEKLFFNIDEEFYNSIFYKGYFEEKSEASNYYSLSLLFLKEIEISPSQFYGYKIILNPELPETHYSTHKTSISKYNDVVVTNLETKLLKFVFSEKILTDSKDSGKSELYTKTLFISSKINGTNIYNWRHSWLL